MEVGRKKNKTLDLAFTYIRSRTENATDKPFVDGRFRRAKRFKHSSEIEQLNSLGNRILSWGKSPFVNVVVDFAIFKT